MKKLLLLFVSILFIGCSDDDSNSVNSGIYNPPDWIQGTWGMAETEFTNEVAYFKFTSDDICQLTSLSSVCWKEMAQNYQTSGVELNTDEEITSDYYEATIGASGVNNTLKFERISATKIIWLSGNFELIKLD